jgi:hypothetical protein
LRDGAQGLAGAASDDERTQAQDEGNRNHKGENFGGVSSEWSKVYAAIDERDVGLAVVGFKDELGGIGKDQADAGGHEDLHEVRAVPDGTDQQQITDVTKAEEKYAGRKKSQVGIEPVFAKMGNDEAIKPSG